MVDIVAIFLNPFLTDLVNTTKSLIQEESQAIKGVKKEVEKLSSTLITIQAVLKDAEQRQLDPACDESLEIWLEKLKDAACDAENILNSFATETSLRKTKQPAGKIRTRISIRKVGYKSSVAKKIKEISAKLDEIAKQKKDFHLNRSSDGGRPQNLPQTTFFVDTTAVFGRDSDKEILINQMLSNESDVEGDISVIPIIGRGGLGKTTLAQLIFNDEKVREHFEFRIWICVTADFNFRRILKEMIEFHTEMECSDNLQTSILVSRFLKFASGKHFLLVLDDVWTKNYQEWERLESLLKQGGRGSRVLVTTRTTKVSDIMGTRPPYRLERLPENESWSLFKKIAFKDSSSLPGDVQQELEDIGREIVSKCKGLPLAVRAMGGLLRGNVDKDKWNQILRHSIRELEKEEDKSP